jgi:acyl-[acyl-carrier-protein]-phospholipid O-acyltransferase / long-chain-fatty-acid--[acyl-carrier-protein] ligase
VRDAQNVSLSYRKLIQSPRCSAPSSRRCRRRTRAVGVLLPNSVGVAVVFFALQTIGRVPAMLNFTAGAGNLALACKAAQVGVVLTSRAFVERARLEPLIDALSNEVNIVYLDDIRTHITFGDKLAGPCAASRPQVTLPARATRR